jgi:hypothetical protein
MGRLATVGVTLGVVIFVGVDGGATVLVGTRARGSVAVSEVSNVILVGEAGIVIVFVARAFVGKKVNGNNPGINKKTERMPAHNRTVAAPRPIHSPVFLRGAGLTRTFGWVRLAGGSPRLAITV